MIIFVSDMHLTDQTLAPSVPLSSLYRLFEEVKQATQSKKKIRLVMLGDIFDVLRSSHWLVRILKERFEYNPVTVRPWHTIDTPVEKIMANILSGIKRNYGEFFEEMKQLENLEMLWVPGNHDRLMKISVVGENYLNQFGIKFAGYEFADKKYGVVARHGHIWDHYNMRGKKYRFSPFGDGIVIEILNKIQVEAAKKRRIVEFNHEDIAFLGAVEYVRPHVMVPLWIRERTEHLSDVLLKHRIRDAWRDVVADFQKTEILEVLSVGKREAFNKLLDMSKNYATPIATLGGFLEKLIQKKDIYKSRAENEEHLKNPQFKFVVYGHTHNPKVSNLSVSRYYINTGWWERVYDPQGFEDKPMMSRFHFLPIERDTLKPELKTVYIDTKISWTPRRLKQQSPASCFRKAEKAETLDEKEALVENGIIELISDTPQIRLRSLIDQTEQGFDMLVRNRIRRKTLGNVVAVDIRPEVNLSYIDILARNAQKAQADGAWVFSTGMVSDEIKEKANESKIMVFDTNDLKMFNSGGHFVSFLRSYETPFMGANSTTSIKL